MPFDLVESRYASARYVASSNEFHAGDTGFVFARAAHFREQATLILVIKLRSSYGAAASRGIQVNLYR